MSISVVTCCMNRNDHLAQTVTQWLALDCIDEVVVVDWSSQTPVADTLRHLPKDKISVVRVVGETHWALARAYNLGIVHTKSDKILKIDADCFLDARMLDACQPDAASFYAGDWRTSLPRGKTASVNGQCFFTREAFEAVNGFNELLQDWGYDDEDFYERLKARGFARCDIDCDLFSFIEHSDEHRTLNMAKTTAARPAQQLLEQVTGVRDWKNRFICQQMPWGKWFPRAQFRRLAVDGVVTVLERKRELEIPVPPAILYLAQLEAGRIALSTSGHDPNRIAAADYAGVIDLFEDWMNRLAREQHKAA